MNCSVKGHLARQCTSATMCTKCNGPHLSILYVESKKSSIPLTNRSVLPPPEEAKSSTIIHTSMTDAPKTVLLVVCQIKVIGPSGSGTKARASIDPGLSKSFVSEHVIQLFHFPLNNSAIMINGIGGFSCDPSQKRTQLCRLRKAD